MDYPKISIVTPVFNQVKYLEETIQSILNQKYPNLEYIIIDGGSTDGTIDIIKKYESQISFWTSEPDKGMYDAIQKGFNHSTGEIMGWLNADDIFLPKSLFAIAKSFTCHSNVNWITSHHAVIDEKGIITAVKQSINYSKLYFYLPSSEWHGNEIGQESTFWRRLLWEKAGSTMSKSLKMAGDFELWIRFFHFDSLFVVNSLFGAFRMREGQLSLDMEHYWEECKQVLISSPLTEKEMEIITSYTKKKNLVKYINKLKILNGNRVCGLSKYEKNHILGPQTLDI